MKHQNRLSLGNRQPVVFNQEDAYKSFPNMSKDEAHKHYRALTVMRIYDQIKVNHEHARSFVVNFISRIILSNWDEFLVPMKEKTNENPYGVVIMDNAIYSPFVVDQDKLKQIMSDHISKIKDVNDWNDNLIQSMTSYGGFNQEIESLSDAIVKIINTHPLYSEIILPLEQKLKNWQEKYENMRMNDLRDTLKQEQMDLLLDWDENEGFFAPFNSLYKEPSWFNCFSLNKEYYELAASVLGIPFNTLLFLENKKNGQCIISKYFDPNETPTLNLDEELHDFSNDELEKISQVPLQGKEHFIKEMKKSFPYYENFDDWDYLWEIYESNKDLLSILDSLITDKQS